MSILTHFDNLEMGVSKGADAQATTLATKQMLA